MIPIIHTTISYIHLSIFCNIAFSQVYVAENKTFSKKRMENIYTQTILIGKYKPILIDFWSLHNTHTRKHKQKYQNTHS